MNYNYCKKELKKLLQKNEPGVIVFSGVWGVGKTHLIKKLIVQPEEIVDCI